MTHPEIANLMTEYVDGLLDTARARQVETHLQACPECSAMLEDARFAMTACHEAVTLEPSPWLLPRIVRATLGERRPSLGDRLIAALRAFFRPQVAYSLSMAVFSLSFILYSAGVKLRSFSLRDLNPDHWAYQANSRGHLLVARAEKYYYDLRFVVEIQSILDDLRQPSSAEPGVHGKQEKPGGGSSDALPFSRRKLALSNVPPLWPRAGSNFAGWRPGGAVRIH